MELKENLIKLLEPAIPSGSEIENSDSIKEILGKYCDEVKRDKLGNLIGLKKGIKSDYKVMLAAHMDEIGLMVKHIDDKGFIRFAFIGGVDQRILPGQEVIIHGNKNLRGIIGTKPPHIQEPEERQKAIKTENMFIDTGLDRDEVKKYVNIGDYITFDRKPMELKNSCFASNALDDRAGLAVIICALRELEKMKFDGDVYAVATIQEEVGLRGATVSTYGINPDIGIAIDVCHGSMPEVADYETQKLGGGPVLALGPNIHPKLFKGLKDICEEYKIPYQLDPESASTGTDAWAIQITREGIPTALVSIPLRYMHTTVETVDLDDIKMSGRLLALFISSISNEFMEGLACF